MLRITLPLCLLLAAGGARAEGSVADFAFRALLEVEALGADPFEAGGVSVEAERFRLTAPEGLDLSLWYTPEGVWVGLETVRDGRVVRYEPDGAGALARLGGVR
jgi:hypothetical protein